MKDIKLRFNFMGREYHNIIEDLLCCCGKRPKYLIPNYEDTLWYCKKCLIKYLKENKTYYKEDCENAIKEIMNNENSKAT